MPHDSYLGDYLAPDIVDEIYADDTFDFSAGMRWVGGLVILPRGDSECEACRASCNSVLDEPNSCAVAHCLGPVFLEVR